jgi:crossover junction endodeoxyribonuclease RusA
MHLQAGVNAPLVLELPWPDARLKPNSRVHFMSLATAKREAKDAANWTTRATIGRNKFVHDGTSDIVLKQVAHPPDNRARDRDNLDASLKAARDGIALGLGVNDKHFRPTGIEWGEVIPGGRIVITVTA